MKKVHAFCLRVLNLIIAHRAPVVYVERTMLSLHDACRYMNLTQNELQKLVTDLAVPHYKSGGKYWFFTAEIDLYLRRNRISTQAEIDHDLAELAQIAELAAARSKNVFGGN